MRCDYDREHCRSKQASAAPNKIAALSNGGCFCLLLNHSDQNGEYDRAVSGDNNKLTSVFGVGEGEIMVGGPLGSTRSA